MRRFLLRLEEGHLGLVLLPWLVAAVTVLFLKFGILVTSGFRESGIGLRTSGSLTAPEKLLLFRADVELCFLLIPILILGLTLPLPKILKAIGSTVFSLLVVAGANLEFLIFKVTGSFVSLVTIWRTAKWIMTSHDTSVIAVRGRDIVLIMIEVAGTLGAGVLTLKCAHPSRRWLNSATLAVFALGSMLALGGSLVPQTVLAWSKPLLETQFESLFPGADRSSEFQGKSISELMEVYRTESRWSRSEDSSFRGRAKNYNVIFFIMETTPAQVFDPASDDLKDMPYAREIRRHAFVCSHHYTSFPLTNRATFSIFTSLYTREAPGLMLREQTLPIPGLIGNLRDAGYKTGFYGFVWKSVSERDDLMLKSLGFDKIVEPILDRAKDRNGAETFMGPLHYTEAHDLEVLHGLQRDIRDWSSHRQKFVAAFFPELGHDPWRELEGRRSRSDIEKGHALAAHQDAWLGAIVEELRRDGELEHTIIVVTGDHGLRFLDFPPHGTAKVVSRGRLDDLMMRVPLMIYVPKTLPQTVKIDAPTSHIDITPTVSELLGITSGRELEQGVPIWDWATGHRRLFLSMDTFGASGYVDAGEDYFSVSNLTFRARSIEFQDSNALRSDSEDAKRAREIVSREDSLQDEIIRQLLTKPNQLLTTTAKTLHGQDYAGSH